MRAKENEDVFSPGSMQNGRVESISASIHSYLLNNLRELNGTLDPLDPGDYVRQINRLICHGRFNLPPELDIDKVVAGALIERNAEQILEIREQLKNSADKATYDDLKRMAVAVRQAVSKQRVINSYLIDEDTKRALESNLATVIQDFYSYVQTFYGYIYDIPHEEKAKKGVPMNGIDDLVHVGMDTGDIRQYKGYLIGYVHDSIASYRKEIDRKLLPLTEAKARVCQARHRLTLEESTIAELKSKDRVSSWQNKRLKRAEQELAEAQRSYKKIYETNFQLLKSNLPAGYDQVIPKDDKRDVPA